MKVTCPDCKRAFEVTPRTRAKVSGGAVGALIGRAISRHWLIVLLGAAAGATLGHMVDEDQVVRCGECGRIRGVPSTTL